MKILIFLFLIFTFLYHLNIKGGEVKHCYIQDYRKHARNKALLKEVLDEERILQDVSKEPIEKAYHIAEAISRIAKTVIERGFLIEAYAIPKSGPLSYTAFNCFALWEGEYDSKHPIPLTFFVYIWPPKGSDQLKLSIKSHTYYGSNIHSHPILCAFTAVHGCLIQRNFKLIAEGKKQVLLVSEEECREFVGFFDDLHSRSIHQLYANLKPCLSLHAYGLGSCEKVVHCFKSTLQSHSYHE